MQYGSTCSGGWSGDHVVGIQAKLGVYHIEPKVQKPPDDLIRVQMKNAVLSFPDQQNQS
jgi:hypothetical protein